MSIGGHIQLDLEMVEGVGPNNSAHVPSVERLAIEMVEEVVMKGMGSTGSPEIGTKYLLCVSYEHQIFKKEVTKMDMGESWDKLLLSSHRISLE